MKVGVLAYTYGINYHSNEEYPELTNYLADPNDKNFKEIKQNVINDFNKIKKENVDFIIVLPHYGTQFNYSTDKYQNTWNRIFADNGANLILGDHPHVVEPIEYIGNTAVINSPGNYVNSYIGNDSDCSMMVKIYINKKSKKIISTSIIPLLAMKNDKSYYAMPIYDALTNIDIYNKLTSTEIKRLKYANKLITKTAINKKNDNLEEEYYFNSKGYIKQNPYYTKINSKDKNTTTYKLLNNSNRICMIGDSITEGTVNNYHPWYEYISSYFNNKDFINISKGGYTSLDIINSFKDKIIESKCDLFIINIGTNDIRMNMLNSNTYIKNIEKILSFTNNENVILMAPWETTKNDFRLNNNYSKKKSLYKEYNKELKELASSNKNYYYHNPNIYIKKAITFNKENTYILDGIHPNANYGINLYSISLFR